MGVSMEVAGNAIILKCKCEKLYIPGRFGLSHCCIICLDWWVLGPKQKREEMTADEPAFGSKVKKAKRKAKSVNETKHPAFIRYQGRKHTEECERENHAK